jgi:adhesin transport system membrane fusion protein
VIPSSDIQKVQNFDGGLVSDILVKTGDHVDKGDPLMKIDTTRFQASVEEVKEERLTLLARKARLNAQLEYNPRKKLNKIDFPTEVEGFVKYMELENNIFQNKVEEYQSSLKILELQFEQKVQEKKEIESTINQLGKSVKIVKDQLQTIERMVRSGSKSRVELLSMQKELNQLEGDLSAAKLSLPRSEMSIVESENKIREKVKAFRSETYSELQEVESELNKLESRLVSESDKLEKTTIRSPVNGRIKQININTIGGVVKSGVDLIEIGPDSDILLVEAKIDPKDIAFISPAQKAVVKITAYDFSVYGGLEGKIIEISADSIVDPDSKDGKSFYRVVVQTDKNYLERNGEILPIIPGMVASVDIITGKKTIMDYFLKPIIKVKENALHER